MTTLSPATGALRPCRPLTPRQRAKVRLALAAEIGDGRDADRHQVAARLFGATADADVTTLDEPVSITDTAIRLGVSPATVRRYLAPSSGKLTRLGTGACPRSIQKLAGGAK